jgi:hypothetical protein
VLGGRESPLFKEFIELSCRAFLLLRKHSDIIVSKPAQSVLHSRAPYLTARTRRHNPRSHQRDRYASHSCYMPLARSPG